MLRFVLAAVCLIAAASVRPAVALETLCAKRPAMIKHLFRKHAERPIAIGLANNGGVIEVLKSGGSGSWTIIVSWPDGTACMIAAGENWEPLPTVKALTAYKRS